MPLSAQVLDIQPSEKDLIISGAGELWSKFYGIVRASGVDNRAQRSDAGCPRVKQPSSKPSLATWVNDRHTAVGSKTTDLVLDNLQPDDTLWTESHDKELKFQKDALSSNNTVYWFLTFAMFFWCPQLQMLVNMARRANLPCQDKQVMLMAEEVMAGRMEVLESLPLDQLQKVLDEVTRKRKCDHIYIRESKKRGCWGNPPKFLTFEDRRYLFLTNRYWHPTNSWIHSFLRAYRRHVQRQGCATI